MDFVCGTVSRWIEDREPSLIALDAPLGWPAHLATQLQTHRAGRPLAGDSNDLFRRRTDQFTHRTVGGRPPLEVGADRIARVAAHALRTLAAIRENTGQALPLAWEVGLPVVPSVIEVYPAATLRARGLPSDGYKSKESRALERRETIVEALAQDLVLDEWASDMIENDDALDAVVCLLAAQDFIEALAIPPTDQEVAALEGWIWFADPKRVGRETQDHL